MQGREPDLFPIGMRLFKVCVISYTLHLNLTSTTKRNVLPFRLNNTLLGNTLYSYQLHLPVRYVHVTVLFCKEKRVCFNS